MKVDGVEKSVKTLSNLYPAPQKHILPMKRQWQSSCLFSFRTLIKQNPSIGIVVPPFPPGFFTLQCLQVEAPGCWSYSVFLARLGVWQDSSGKTGQSVID